MRFGLKMPLAALVLGGVILAAGGDFDILTFRKLGALEQSFTPASEIFVSPQWLEENFHQVRLLDAGRSLNDFKDQHILGAGRIDIYKLQDCIFRLQAEDDYRNLLEIIERAGVFKNRPVVVYDTGDGIEAAYLFWLLEYLGHPRVHILNGGIQAWASHGGVLAHGGGVYQRGVFRADVKSKGLELSANCDCAAVSSNINEMCFDIIENGVSLSTANFETANSYVQLRAADCFVTNLIDEMADRPSM